MIDARCVYADYSPVGHGQREDERKKIRYNEEKEENDEEEVVGDDEGGAGEMVVGRGRAEISWSSS